tara:strand:+ start:25 stop:1536 length:1512 start_codon:yes stop_codon:yes gene_type:complete
MAAPAKSEQIQKIQAPSNIGTNLARTTLGQGLLFGFGDEVEAFARAITTDKNYDESLQQVRSEIESFRQQAPAAAYGSEILGSIPSTILTGGAGLAGRVGLQGPGRIAALQGGAYGFGASEGNFGERATSAATSAAISTGLTKGAKKLLPVKAKQAKELLQKGIPLTPGQSLRDSGSIGSYLVTALEDLSTSYPGAGAPIQAKRLESLIKFNRVLLDEAVEPLDIKIPKSLQGKDAFLFVDEELGKKYTDVLPKISISNARSFEDKILDTILDSALDPVEQNTVLRNVEKNILNKIKDNKIAGKDVKNIETNFGRLEQSFLKKGGIEGEIGVVFGDIKRLLRKEIEFQNQGAKELQKINNVYRNLLPINDAMQQAVIKEGIFTPAQILRAIKKTDKTKRKVKTIAGQQPLQETALLGEQVLGNIFPDSGTASRLLAQDVIINPVKLGKLAPPAIASEALMSRPFGRSPTTGILTLPEATVRTTGPSISSLLATNLVGQENTGQ